MHMFIVEHICIWHKYVCMYYDMCMLIVEKCFLWHKYVCVCVDVIDAFAGVLVGHGDSYLLGVR